MSRTVPSEAPVAPELLVALRNAAVDYVARAASCTLDGSEESLAFVDHYIAQVREGLPPKPEVLRLIAAALGVYLGELLIARFGGRWLTVAQPAQEAEDGEDADGEVTRWRVELEAAPLRVDPIAMAAAALVPPGDDSEDVAGFALGPGHGQLLGPLSEALGRLAPVSQDYYYSLTGRFETLTFIVDLLLDLKRQAQPEEPEQPHQDEDAPILH